MDKLTDLDFAKVEGLIKDGDAVLRKISNQKTDDKMDAVALGNMLKLLQAYDEATNASGIEKWFVPGTPFGIEHCRKHKLFFESGADYNERLFMAANRSGKSIAGAFEAACHATGIYPTWWAGRRFDKPTKGWVMGSTARATRDTVQKELIGPVGAWGTGMISKELLGKFWALQGVPQGIDLIQVRHVSGGWSLIGFKNYEQPLQAFFGEALDWAWMDEECPDEIYNETLIRTMTTNGIVFNTFTPLKGLTPMVVRYSEKADFLGGAKKFINIQEEVTEDLGEDARLVHSKSKKAVVQATWDDAPWLSEEAKERMLEDTPPHLREARRTGKPALGSGNVYPLDLEHILCTPFEIPSYYRKLVALDVGWNRTAALWGAIDPQTDTLYIYSEYYIGQQPPAIHAHAIRGRGQWIPVVIDPASRGRSQVDGTQLMQSYKELGLQLFPALNEVESGIQNAWNRMTTGKLKVFNTLPNFAKEYSLYRRDLNGKIVKDNDHLMDCMRYLVNNINRAKSLDSMVNKTKYKGTIKYDV